MRIKNFIRRKTREVLFRPEFKDGRYKILGNWLLLDDADALSLSRLGVYEPDNTRFIQKLKPKTSMDIGANLGYYTLLMADNSEKVYSFEPEPENFKRLSGNVEFNNKDNVILFNQALGDQTGEVDLHLCPYNAGMHRTYESEYCLGGDIVKARIGRLDDIGEIDGQVDLVKMDAEGAEPSILKGMTKILEQDNVILAEFHAYALRDAGHDPRDFLEYAKSFGYKVTDMKKNPVDADKLIEKTDCWNCPNEALLFSK